MPDRRLNLPFFPYFLEVKTSFANFSFKVTIAKINYVNFFNCEVLIHIK